MYEVNICPVSPQAYKTVNGDIERYEDRLASMGTTAKGQSLTRVHRRLVNCFRHFNLAQVPGCGWIVVDVVCRILFLSPLAKSCAAFGYTDVEHQKAASNTEALAESDSVLAQLPKLSDMVHWSRSKGLSCPSVPITISKLFVYSAAFSPGGDVALLPAWQSERLCHRFGVPSAWTCCFVHKWSMKPCSPRRWTLSCTGLKPTSDHIMQPCKFSGTWLSEHLDERGDEGLNQVWKFKKHWYRLAADWVNGNSDRPKRKHVLQNWTVRFCHSLANLS